MPRKNRRNRRRKQFTAINLFGPGEQDITDIVEKAKDRGVSQKKSEAREEKRQKATKQAIEEANATTEIYISQLPRNTTPIHLLKSILYYLRLNGLQPRKNPWRIPEQGTRASFDFPVVRIEIKQPKTYYYTHLNANVSLKSSNYANVLLRSTYKAPFIVLGCPVQVSSSHFVSVPGVGSAWRARPDPGSERWRVGLVQVGEAPRHDFFRTFWASAPMMDITTNSHIELNPVTSVLAITVGRPQKMLQADARLNCFRQVEAMLRIEIPFRSICESPFPHRSRGLSENLFSVCIPVTKPPLLYRSQMPRLDLQAVTNPPSSRVWDCTGGADMEVRWIRTVDPTKEQVFARAKTIRVFMAIQDFSRFFRSIYKQCLVDNPKPELKFMTSSKQPRLPDKQAMFREAKQRYGASFGLRYWVDCVLCTRRISVDSITAEFWTILTQELSEDMANNMLDMMYHRLSEEEEGFKGTPVEMLRACIASCGIDDEKTVSNITGSQGLSEPDVPDDNGSPNTPDMNELDSLSVGSFESNNTEEFEVDMLFRELDINLDEIRDELQGNQADKTASVKSLDIPPAVADIAAAPKLRHYAYIRRVICTPTQCIVARAETDLLNRVLRAFFEHMDRFLRISFCDEDGGSVGHVGSNDVLARVRMALRDGVYAAGEKFVFLAFSNSQLRDHSAWFYNETPDPSSNVKPPTAEEIRSWMGDFSHIRVPGKYAARQGQAFSSTVGTVVLTDVQHAEEDDIYDTSRTYAFSDGVGLMSSSLAKNVAQKLNIRKRERIPSAFQIRFGGAKGMLTVWDDALPNNRKVDVIVRKSMKKFESTHRALEVVGYAKRLPMFLNRQIIMLLSVMGVPDHAFELLQSRLLSRLNKAMHNDGATEALNLLYSSGCCTSDAKLKISSPMMNAASFFRAGLTCVNCEHLFNMMDAFRKCTIRELMNRARIPIDSDKGVSAMGVMDELGVLNEWEVFIQYTDPLSGKHVVVTGPVTVGRSPCLHPGDIQPLYAVDCTPLHHLVDVIVFPQKGDRPIPSKLSGGDLDGDIYFCLFHDALGVKTLPYPAMDYTAPDPVTLNHAVTTNDVADFFVQYIRNDKLGQIANAHVVHGDREVNGAASVQCMTLAELHSTAVDFAKTGVPAILPSELQPKNIAKQYPDFMGKHPKVSYKSEKVLGKLHRQCYAKAGDQETVSRYVVSKEKEEIDSIIESIPHNDMLKDAIRTCQLYNYDLGRIMDEFGVKTEGELISGQVLKFSARHAQLRGRREYFSLKMRMNRKASELKSEYRDYFFNRLGQRSKHSAESIAMACAWYTACEIVAEGDAKNENDNRRLISFPWVVADVLLPVIGSELKN